MSATTHSAREASDWLSPIIIKELRQGMRGRLFLYSFVLIQVAMIFCASGALLGASVSVNGTLDSFTALFWFIIAIPLLFLLPWAGHGTLRNEIKANGLELVYLTRMTPWRIVAGKWAALCAQGLLFVFSILPYLVLRYFLGGVDMVTELAVFAFLILSSGLLTAITVGFSAHNPWIVRIGFLLFLLLGLSTLADLIFDMGRPFPPGSVAGTAEITFLTGFVLFLFLIVLLMFEAGAAKIAPAAQPRLFNVRIIGLLLLTVAGIINITGEAGGIPLIVAGLPLLVICFFPLCNNPRWIRSIYAPYSRFGLAGRLSARLLFYPGWPSAVVYTTLVMLLFGGFAMNLPAYDREDTLLSLLVLYSALIFPVALTRLLRPETPNGVSWFLSIHLAMLFISLIVFIFYQVDVNVAPLVVFLPTSLALLIFWDALPANDLSMYTIATTVMIIISLAAITYRWIGLGSSFRKMEVPTP